ncbi:MAG: hypothetical protein BGN83_01105, partial [Rhizobium sp. 63-7]
MKDFLCQFETIVDCDMKKGRTTIPLKGFQALDAVARHLSVTEAATELGVTQSAVSHQLRKLEEHLGTQLLDRRGRIIGLTETGRKLARSLNDAFDLMEQSSTAAIGGSHAVVRVGIYSSFATGWFMPALALFCDAHPNIDIRLVMLYDPHEISGRIADVFITSEPAAPGYWTTRLFPETLVPVISKNSPPVTYDTGLPLITAEIQPALAGRDWEAFAVLNKIDMATLRLGRWVCCTHYIFSLEMVRAGMGAALLPNFMAHALLATGELQRLPGKPVPTGQSYEAQVKYERRNEPDIVRFISWLRTT